MVTSDKLKILFFFSIFFFSPKYTYALITGIDEKHSDMPWDGCHQERKKRTKRSQRSWVRAMLRAGAAPPQPNSLSRGMTIPARHSRPRRCTVVAVRVSVIEAFGDGSVRFPVGSQPARPQPHGGLALSPRMWAVGRWVSAAVEVRGHRVTVPRCCRGRRHPGMCGAATQPLPRSEPPHPPIDLP